MIPNINPETGVPFGYVAAQELKPEVVDDLMEKGTNLSYKAAREEAEARQRREWEDECETACERALAETGDVDLTLPDFVFNEDKFHNEYENYEPIVEGTYEGVHYRSSWLGGALHFFIFNSPHITFFGHRASPCVPNACILHADRDGTVQGYTVPDDWWLPE